MAAELAAPADLQNWVGRAEDFTGEYQDILDALEELLEELTGQVFTASTTAIADEPHDGMGLKWLYLRRPVDSGQDVTVKVSSIADTTNPDQTIPAADIQVDARNNRRIIRVQNGVFPRGNYNLFVSYTPLANLPSRAKQAMQEAGAFLVNRKGKEHESGASVGEFGNIALLEAELNKLPAWRNAVSTLAVWDFA